MMLLHLDEDQAASRVENAVIQALESGRIKSMSAGQMGMSTTELSDYVAELI